MSDFAGLNADIGGIEGSYKLVGDRASSACARSLAASTLDEIFALRLGRHLSNAVCVGVEAIFADNHSRLE